MGEWSLCTVLHTWIFLRPFAHSKRISIRGGTFENLPFSPCDVIFSWYPHPTLGQETKQACSPWSKIVKIFYWCLHNDDLEYFIVFICLDTRIFQELLRTHNMQILFIYNLTLANEDRHVYKENIINLFFTRNPVEWRLWVAKIPKCFFFLVECLCSSKNVHNHLKKGLMSDRFGKHFFFKSLLLRTKVSKFDSWILSGVYLNKQFIISIIAWIYFSRLFDAWFKRTRAIIKGYILIN